MAKDILDMYGPNSAESQAARPTNGGQMTPKPIPYSSPVGPKGISDAKSPGLHGENCGNCGTQGRY